MKDGIQLPYVPFDSPRKRAYVFHRNGDKCPTTCLSWIKLITRPRDGDGCSSAPSPKSQPRICQWGTALIHHAEGSLRRWRLSTRAPLCAAVSANRTAVPHALHAATLSLCWFILIIKIIGNAEKLACHVLDKTLETRQRRHYKRIQQ